MDFNQLMPDNSLGYYYTYKVTIATPKLYRKLTCTIRIDKYIINGYCKLKVVSTFIISTIIAEKQRTNKNRAYSIPQSKNLNLLIECLNLDLSSCH